MMQVFVLITCHWSVFRIDSDHLDASYFLWRGVFKNTSNSNSAHELELFPRTFSALSSFAYLYRRVVFSVARFGQNIDGSLESVLLKGLAASDREFGTAWSATSVKRASRHLATINAEPGALKVQGGGHPVLPAGYSRSVCATFSRL